MTLKHLSFLSKVCRGKQIIFENLNKINKRNFFMRNANDRNWTKNPKPTSRVKSWSSDQRVLKIFYYIYKCKNQSIYYINDFNFKEDSHFDDERCKKVWKFLFDKKVEHLFTGKRFHRKLVMRERLSPNSDSKFLFQHEQNWLAD